MKKQRKMTKKIQCKYLRMNNICTHKENEDYGRGKGKKNQVKRCSPELCPLKENK